MEQNSAFFVLRVFATKKQKTKKNKNKKKQYEQEKIAEQYLRSLQLRNRLQI